MRKKEMAICKFCGAIIDYLEVTEYISGGLSYSEEGFDEEPDERNSELKFFCPKCDKLIANDEFEAQEFFINKDEVAEMVTRKVKDGTMP